MKIGVVLVSQLRARRLHASHYVGESDCLVERLRAQIAVHRRHIRKREEEIARLQQRIAALRGEDRAELGCSDHTNNDT